MALFRSLGGVFRPLTHARSVPAVFYHKNVSVDVISQIFDGKIQQPPTGVSKHAGMDAGTEERWGLGWVEGTALMAEDASSAVPSSVLVSVDAN